LEDGVSIPRNTRSVISSRGLLLDVSRISRHLPRQAADAASAQRLTSRNALAQRLRVSSAMRFARSLPDT
jgi:hypothetical protein